MAFINKADLKASPENVRAFGKMLETWQAIQTLSVSNTNLQNISRALQFIPKMSFNQVVFKLLSEHGQIP